MPKAGLLRSIGNTLHLIKIVNNHDVNYMVQMQLIISSCKKLNRKLLVLKIKHMRKLMVRLMKMIYMSWINLFLMEINYVSMCLKEKLKIYMI